MEKNILEKSGNFVSPEKWQPMIQGLVWMLHIFVIPS